MPARSGGDRLGTQDSVDDNAGVRRPERLLLDHADLACGARLRNLMEPAPTKTRADWLLPGALIVFSTVPVAAGAVRLVGLARGATITQENARFFATPVPVVLHILSAVLFTVVGALQFAPRLRRRHPSSHRAAGWVSSASGLVAGLSGLWMTHFYPRVDGDGELLYAFRLLFGSAMVACVILGVAAIRRRDIVRHGAWMTRGYAIGMGASTQALVHLPWILVLGKPGELGRAVLMGAGWAINLTVAEWVIRRRRSRARPVRASAAGLNARLSPGR